MGMYTQGGKLGVKLGIAALPQDFLGSGGKRLAASVHGKTREIVRLCDLKTYSFAGLLPGIMHQARIRREPHERASTASAVAQAALTLLNAELPQDAPIVLLGGNGFIGRALNKALSNREVVVVDLSNGTRCGRIPDDPCLVINVASPTALDELVPLIPQHSTVLNEAYPPPRREILTGLAARKIKLRHVAGVVGEAWPPFPFEYSAGIHAAPRSPARSSNPFLSSFMMGETADIARTPVHEPRDPHLVDPTFSEVLLRFLKMVTPFIALAILIGVFWGQMANWVGIAALLAMYAFTGLGVTIGFHRLFTHKSFATVRPLKIMLAIGGCMSAEDPLMRWVAVHRRHHQLSDQPGDPHSPHTHDHEHGLLHMLHGLTHAHLGWFYNRPLFQTPTVHPRSVT